MRPTVANFDDFAGVRQFGRGIHFYNFILNHQDFVFHRGSREEHIQIIFAFDAFLNNFHVEQTEETGAEAKAKRLRGFRLKRQ